MIYGYTQIYKYGVNGSSVDFFHFARDLAL